MNLFKNEKEYKLSVKRKEKKDAIKSLQKVIVIPVILDHFDFVAFMEFYQTSKHRINFSGKEPKGQVFAYCKPFKNQLL